jgi:hypothetical protein
MKEETIKNWLEYDPTSFMDRFDKEPFKIRHRLTGHPLLQLPAIIELGGRLLEKQVEFNSGEISLNQDYLKTPKTGLSADETLRRIEECRSWMVLKNVETYPPYGILLKECLEQVALHSERVAPGMCHPEAFIFVSSPDSITPYHMDPEHNFLLQIRGVKNITIFNGHDRNLLSHEQLETFHRGAHRNLEYRPEFAAMARPFVLEPGDGVHVPVTSPHWVKNGPTVSISFSITFRSRSSNRTASVYRVNSILRSKGLSPVPPGRSAFRDRLKVTVDRGAEKLARALRRG